MKSLRPRIEVLPMFVVLCAALGAAGCERVEPPFPDGITVDFRTADPSSTQLADPGAALAPLLAPPAPLREDQEEVIATIAANPEGFLRVRPPTEVLNEAELVFFAAGRLFELAAWYADAVERGVVDLRARSAWAYERAGLHSEALRQARTCVDERPEDAECWFVLGFVLGQSTESNDAALREIRDAFAKAVELDPEFSGPSNVSAAELRRQVRDIDARLGGGVANPHGGMGRGAGMPGSAPAPTLPSGHPPIGAGDGRPAGR